MCRVLLRKQVDNICPVFLVSNWHLQQQQSELRSNACEKGGGESERERERAREGCCRYRYFDAIYSVYELSGNVGASLSAFPPILCFCRHNDTCLLPHIAESQGFTRRNTIKRFKNKKKKKERKVLRKRKRKRTRKTENEKGKESEKKGKYLLAGAGTALLFKLSSCLK